VKGNISELGDGPLAAPGLRWPDDRGGYWPAEDQYEGGADVHLEPIKSSVIGRRPGLGGTTLTGVQTIGKHDSVVESECSNSYALDFTINLPSAYPLGDGQGGRHGRVIVG